MPTNILRKQAQRPQPGRQKSAGPASLRKRVVLIRTGRISIRAELLETPTADRIWASLPIYSTAEIFGRAVHFEIPVESGRDRSAKVLASLGELYYWSEEDRIFLVFGPTPISRPGEFRLPNPCNVWAKTADDLTLLKNLHGGERISLSVA